MRAVQTRVLLYLGQEKMAAVGRFASFLELSGRAYFETHGARREVCKLLQVTPLHLVLAMRWARGSPLASGHRDL